MPPSNAKIVYALVESRASALYRSDDGGATWEPRDTSQQMVWRPFYFARLVIDPTNPNRLFKPTSTWWSARTAGAAFAVSGGGSHGDWHRSLDRAEQSQACHRGDDGGLWLSYDGGNRWWKGTNLRSRSSITSRSTTATVPGVRRAAGQQLVVGDSSYPGGVTNARWGEHVRRRWFWMIPDPTDPDAV